MNNSLVTLFLSCAMVLTAACGGAEFSVVSKDQTDAGNDAVIDHVVDSKPEIGEDAVSEVKAETGITDAAHEPDAVLLDTGLVDVSHEPDVVVEADASLPETGKDALVEAEPVDVIQDVVSEPPPVSPLCSQYGEAGKIMVYATAGVGPSLSLTIFGSVNYPAGSGVSNIGWWQNGGGWCWSPMGVGQATCFPKLLNNDHAPAVKDAVVEFQPGVASGLNQPPSSSLCEMGSCSIGSYVVCAGYYEVCSIVNGVGSGSATLVDPDNDQKPNIRCKI